MKPNLFLLLLLSLLPAFAESRTWTNSEGKTLEGEYVRATEKEVYVKLPTGKTVKLALNTLSQDDKDFTQKTMEQETADKDAKKAEEQKARLSFKWSKKMDVTMKEAKEYDLPVMVLFTGSSWCGYCVKLEEEVLSQPEFKKLASGKMLGIKYECGSPGDYSSEGKKKAKEFGIGGVPSYIILDKDGKKIGQGGYHKGITPKEVVDKITGGTK